MNNFVRKVTSILIGMVIATFLIVVLLYFLNRSFFEKPASAEDKTTKTPVTTQTSTSTQPAVIDLTTGSIPDTTQVSGTDTTQVAEQPIETPVTLPKQTDNIKNKDTDKIGNLIRDINKSNSKTNNKSIKVQMGSYKRPAEANKQKAKLAMLNINSQIVKVNIKGIDYYRVISNPVSQQEANNIKRILNKNNIDSLIISE